MILKAYARDYWRTFSFVGLVFATLFFAASMTPSLLPRHFATQGLLSGFALAVGYGVGVLCVWLWLYLELPRPSDQLELNSKRVTTVVVALIVIVFLWREVEWQNSIRELMEMPPVETGYPLYVGLIAGITAVVLVGTVRLIRRCFHFINGKIVRVVPRRIAAVISSVLVAFLVLLVANDVLGKLLLSAADSVFLKMDELKEDKVEQPASPLASGSAESLVDWDTIGLQGKHFITLGPTQEQISEFWGEEAKQPLRVYAGLRTTKTMAERAKLALEELIRVGGFERKVLIVATPTGTGWLDPGAVDTIEYLHRGDTAIVSMQYSYLPSWITILVDPRRSIESGRALFDEIYGHWKTLPKDSRPQLYLQGLSLGSLGSESSCDMLTIFEDPIQGGLWSGPPFPSNVWNRITAARHEDSPFWLPRFRDGSVIRFTGRENVLQDWGEPWSSMRFVYIQHASDPMVFFSPSLAYRRPEWLKVERGPDVSPYLRWLPLVTFLQTAFDLPMATTVPHGYGHNYGAASYADSWIEVTQPEGWTEEMSQRLKEKLAVGAKPF